MARTSTTRIFVWSLALVAAAGAALSLDRLLRERPLEADAVRGSAAILPSPPRGQDQSLSGTVQSVAKTVQAAAKNVDALVGSTGLAGGGDQATPSSPAGPHPARVWSYCATASRMTGWWRMRPDSSPWSLRVFPLGTPS